MTNVSVQQGSSESAPLSAPAPASGQPLSLAGFALTLAILSIVNAGWLGSNAAGIIVPAAYAYGAIALIIGGLWDFRANNVFGYVWSISFGCFWLSLALILQFFAADLISAAGAKSFGHAFGAYLVLWGIFTIYMSVAAYFVAKPAVIAFSLSAFVFVAVGVTNIAGPSLHWLTTTAGYAGLIDALIAGYVSAALVINTTSGAQRLPIWPYPYRKR